MFSFSSIEFGNALSYYHPICICDLTTVNDAPYFLVLNCFWAYFSKIQRFQQKKDKYSYPLQENEKHT